MNVLELSPQFPYPLDHGGAIGIYKLAEAIANYANVTLVTYPSNDTEEVGAGIREMSEWCDVRLVPKPLPSRMKTLMRTMLHGAYPIERRMMPEMFTLIEKTIAEQRFDIVHLDGAQMGKYGLWIKEKFGLPVVLREHNFEALIYERFARNERNPLKKLVASIHGRRLRKEELNFIRHLDAIIPITTEDETLLRKEVPNAWYKTISGGVDTDYYRPDNAQTDPATIVWIGGMTWEPNQDAVYYFANEIFPQVLQQCPSARFEVAGIGTDRLNDLKQKFADNIILHGRAPDTRPLIRRATILICPLRVGGGMRLKLLEFFAMGKPVVSTTIGAEGNLACDDEHIILRDSPTEYADALVWLLNSPDKRQELGASARLLAEEQYSWDSVGKRFYEFYQEVIGHRGH